jgi:hypothetical protein
MGAVCGCILVAGYRHALEYREAMPELTKMRTNRVQLWGDFEVVECSCVRNVSNVENERNLAEVESLVLEVRR